MGFEGKTVFITGASRGIGRGIAVAFAKAGANLCITYNNTRPDETVTALTEAGAGQVEALQLNVADSAACTEAVKKCIDTFGAVDVLVNNAGVTKDGLLMRMKDEDWDEVLNANLKGAFNMCRAVAKPMLKKKAGKIINIGSIVGTVGNPGQANYSASKAGLEGLTKAVAKELASRSITVNLIAPGYITTDMTDALDDKAKDALLQNIPLNKLGTVDDVASAALFLASAGADYITGHVLHVNGGMFM